MMEKMRNKKKKGFTLIELIVVIAIIGILALIAVPKFTDMTKGANERLFEANHRTIVSAVNLYIGEHSGVKPSSLDSLTTLNKAEFTNAPQGATYSVGTGGVVESKYPEHRTEAKRTLTYTP